MKLITIARTASLSALLRASRGANRYMGKTKFVISGDPLNVLSTLFKRNDKGLIEFGWNARSRSPHEVNALLCEEVEFVDYVMEGHVNYTLRAIPENQGLQIELSKLGTNRDKYIDGHVKFHLEQGGFEVVEQAPI